MSQRAIKRLMLSILLLFSCTSFCLPSVTLAQNNDVNINAPRLNIVIPGVEFTPPEKLVSPALNPITDEWGNQMVYVPFIGNYLQAIYKYALLAASICAVVMIVIAGVEWLSSAGNTEAISRAQKRIGNAVIGLLLAGGSYTLLYAINPELVRFRSLKINYVATTDDTFVSSIDRGVSSSNPSSRTGKTNYSKRTSLDAAKEAVDGARSVITAYNKILRETASDEYKKNPNKCPFKYPEEQKIETNYPAPDADQETTYTGFDDIFKRYSNCIDNPSVDWRVLKAIAYHESWHFGIGSKIVKDNGNGFSGLFQTNETYCSGAISSVPGFSASWCKASPQKNTGLNNPEISTMVGAKMLETTHQILRKYNCGNVSGGALLFYSFFGHQSGHGVLIDLLTIMQQEGKTCEDFQTDTCLKAAKAWTGPHNGVLPKVFDYSECSKVSDLKVN